MKNLMVLLFLTIGFSMSAQFQIDVARDSIISMVKSEAANGKWRIEITNYVGISDSVSNTKTYSKFIIQEDTEVLIDSVITSLELRIENEKTAMFIQYERAKAKRNHHIQQMGLLHEKYQRLIRNKAKVTNMKL